MNDTVLGNRPLQKLTKNNVIYCFFNSDEKRSFLLISILMEINVFYEIKKHAIFVTIIN